MSAFINNARELDLRLRKREEGLSLLWLVARLDEQNKCFKWMQDTGLWNANI